MKHKNHVIFFGKIISEFQYCHHTRSNKFYLNTISIQRISGSYDLIPFMISDHLFDTQVKYREQFVYLEGRYSSFNQYNGEHKSLMLYVFVYKFKVMDHLQYIEKPNLINLEGNICKVPIFRLTPLRKQITDLLIAVNRNHKISDFIPCICWGQSALTASKYRIGDKVEIQGKIQSRTYMKKTTENNFENRIAYEVCIEAITPEHRLIYPSSCKN